MVVSYDASRRTKKLKDFFDTDGKETEGDT